MQPLNGSRDAPGGRFVSPVYPGETLRVEFWDAPRDDCKAVGGGEGTVFLLRASCVERSIVVFSNGYVKVSRRARM